MGRADDTSPTSSRLKRGATRTGNWGQTRTTPVSYPNAAGHGKVRQGSVPVRAAPNEALHLTASSLRSSLAAASGGR